jgi:hypothetical protein
MVPLDGVFCQLPIKRLVEKGATVRARIAGWRIAVQQRLQTGSTKDTRAVAWLDALRRRVGGLADRAELGRGAGQGLRDSRDVHGLSDQLALDVCKVVESQVADKFLLDEVRQLLEVALEALLVDTLPVGLSVAHRIVLRHAPEVEANAEGGTVGAQFPYEVLVVAVRRTGFKTLRYGFVVAAQR